MFILKVDQTVSFCENIKLDYGILFYVQINRRTQMCQGELVDVVQLWSFAHTINERLPVSIDKVKSYSTYLIRIMFYKSKYLHSEINCNITLSYFANISNIIQ